jgi:hypothetical protein
MGKDQRLTGAGLVEGDAAERGLGVLDEVVTHEFPFRP